jgi:hypothetical protein
MGDHKSLRRRAEDVVSVLLARNPALLESLVYVGEVAIATECSTAVDEKIGESSIPG